jgi:hypothetical protein
VVLTPSGKQLGWPPASTKVMQVRVPNGDITTAPF